MSRNMWLGLVASVVVVAAALGLLRLVDGDDELALPDTLGDLVATDTAAAYPDREAEFVDTSVKSRHQSYDYNDDKTSKAFDGADVVTRTYIHVDGFDHQVSVVAIAADAGPLLPAYGFADPEVLGFALPTVERVVRGDVECVGTRGAPPRAGAKYTDEDAAYDAVTCQRHSGSLTVRVFGGSDSSLDDVVDLTEDAWDEVS